MSSESLEEESSAISEELLDCTFCKPRTGGREGGEKEGGGGKRKGRGKRKGKEGGDREGGGKSVGGKNGGRVERNVHRRHSSVIVLALVPSSIMYLYVHESNPWTSPISDHFFSVIQIHVPYKGSKTGGGEGLGPRLYT